jgi:glycosyltransferase involved in cell wall biosynthesis
MKIAIITPYHNPSCPDLKQCIDSVKAQTYGPLMHITIGDGCDLATTISDADVYNIPLPSRINNYGDTPRSIGVVYAFSLGADAVIFLDSDNWFAPNHIESLVECYQKTGADVITCRRYLTHLNGDILGVCPESDGEIFCDTNCLMVTKALAEQASLWWLIPRDMHPIDDRVLWDTLIHSTDNIASTGKPTVFYRTAFRFHYEAFNVPAPKNSKLGEDIAQLGDAINELQQRAKTRALYRRASVKTNS